MNNIPTAEEFLKQEEYYDVIGGDEYAITNAMIQFAKLHVIAALQSAASNATTREEEIYTGGLNPEDTSLYCKIQVIDEDSVLNAYSLDNIE